LMYGSHLNSDRPKYVARIDERVRGAGQRMPGGISDTHL
jgi:hypothetical protein